MKKLILTTTIVLLSACSTEPLKTSNTSNYTDLSASAEHKLRQHSILHLGKADGNAEQDDLNSKFSRYITKGTASWYGPQFHGKKTASGEIYDMYAMTAAHNSLPISSYAKVTNLKNKRSVIVRINDRGPFHGDRVMDLSYSAAKKLGIDQAGTGAVEIKAIAPKQALAQMQESAAKQDKSVYLQVGSFGNKTKALKLQHKIVASNLPEAKILSAKRKGATVYKVQMGPINSPESVASLNQQLAKIGVTGTQFVTETSQN
ncbi:MAG: septal ring lytic transglycosylase RlpA family protein [Methylobacter sp.]|nr:septal ring lytic transglycosylase RlpA family protein [Methylobacter sp.]